MERVMSDEERIRRAIEISQRRNNSYYRENTTRVNVNEKRNFSLFKKMVLQTLICLVIYAIFYLITNTNYVFSKQVIDEANNILNYDINFEKIYNSCQSFINTQINFNNSENNIENNNEMSNEINTISEENLQNIQVAVTNDNIENEALQEIESKDEEKKDENSTKEKTQMELDAEEVKKICEFQKPLSGKITSEFGDREVTSKVMSADHKGIDIAANSGTNIISSIDGVVSVAEKNSEYGKFIKIINGEVMTVYAHCKSLKVKVGDKVKSGQTIATVGSTGNSTGPHLHFEIRLSNRYINPRYVIDF